MNVRNNCIGYYLFHDSKRSLWLFCLVWLVRTLVCDDTHSTVCASGVLPCSARVCIVWRINALYFDLVFVPLTGLHLANRVVTHLLLLCWCVKSFSAFCSEYSRARPSTACVSQFSWRAMFTRPISCARSTVTVAATAMAYLSQAVHWCVTN